MMSLHTNSLCCEKGQPLLITVRFHNKDCTLHITHFIK